MKENLIIIHGGGPTAVLNCSLYGAVREAQASGLVEHVYGAVGGTGGLLKEKLLDFGSVPEEELERLPTTPATAIGHLPGRPGGGGLRPHGGCPGGEAHPLRADERRQRHHGRLRQAGGGVPGTGGSPSWASPRPWTTTLPSPTTAPASAAWPATWRARCRELGVDVRSLPIHVVVLEALGRNAGWTTAAAALAREQEGDAPHLLYPPERPFHEDEFLDRVGDMYRKLGGVVVVASEGLHDDEGKPIVPPIFQTGRSTYFGDVSSHLAQLVVRRLGIKARSEKPGILARASIAWQSPVDAAEAEEAGRAACRAVLAGETGQMVAFRRLSSAPYRCETFLVPIEEVMLGERVLPAEYLTAGGTDVTEAFCGWCRPLLGPELPSMARLL